ncbi:hypothetical protein AB0B94_30435 [Micromonospora sp. NPDC048986]|uniref:hypothetical protein n=1 Tax=Micromonospora sp. NPDC048986 TaxID=3155644 RepID=UPI0033EFF3A2
MDEAVKAVERADLDRTQKRAEFDLAHAKAFLGAEGSMDIRKYQAVIATHDLRVEADVADAAFRHLQRRISAINTRVEVGRSVNSALKTEMNLGGLDGTP